jgi:nitrite reductase (NADH) large subunit
VLVALTVLSSRVRLPARLEEYTVHVAWTDSFWKQLTGYGIVLVILAGLLLSVRKRVRRFRLGAYASFRTLHAVLGGVSLVALFAHTGFRLGYNMNRALVLVLLVSAGTGAIVGIASGGATGIASFRARAAEASRKVHDVAFWLLLPLLAFHILKTYYY